MRTQCNPPDGTTLSNPYAMSFRRLIIVTPHVQLTTTTDSFAFTSKPKTPQLPPCRDRAFRWRKLRARGSKRPASTKQLFLIFYLHMLHKSST